MYFVRVFVLCVCVSRKGSAQGSLSLESEKVRIFKEYLRPVGSGIITRERRRIRRRLMNPSLSTEPKHASR